MTKESVVETADGRKRKWHNRMECNNSDGTRNRDFLVIIADFQISLLNRFG